MRLTILILAIAAPLWCQPKPPSPWWVHVSVVAHAMAAVQDGLSSWKQGEGNTLYAEAAGPQVGHFYRTGAARLAGVTGGIILASELVGRLRPTWRRRLAAFNFAAAASHVGVTTCNVIRNPYYR